MQPLSHPVMTVMPSTDFLPCRILFSNSARLLCPLQEQPNGLARRIVSKAGSDATRLLDRTDSHLRVQPRVSGDSGQVGYGFFFLVGEQLWAHAPSGQQLWDFLVSNCCMLAEGQGCGSSSSVMPQGQATMHPCSALRHLPLNFIVGLSFSLHLSQ